MEAAPPPYGQVISHWEIIAQYIPSADLCSAALVCRRWHSTFAPHLWGNPASHFGIENDAVYVALTRFRRTLQTARLTVRSLTHTLHLPPAHAELYNGPHSDWLRDLLHSLPNLQSLIVKGLPFFDYATLQALRYSKREPDHGECPPAGMVELPGSVGLIPQSARQITNTFGLRYLNASRCTNVTSGSLAQALTRFDGLLYLDLSFTYPARDPAVLTMMRTIQGLQVLKLRGISLNDDALVVLCDAIACRVRSLDVRDNHISDRGVRTLLDKCFIHEGTLSQGVSDGRRSPSLLPYLGAEMLEIYQGKDFDGYMRRMLTESFIGRLAIEDTPESGITHLFIANNSCSVEGISGLLMSRRLHVLDVDRVISDLHGPSSPGSHEDTSKALNMPGVEKLTPVFAKYASASMKYLRIDHKLVTKEAPDFHPDEIVVGASELGDSEILRMPNGATELDGRPVQVDTVELPTVTTPKYELPGDPLHIFVSPSINDPQHEEAILDSASQDQLRRGSAFAPEPVDSASTGVQNPNLLEPISAIGPDAAKWASPTSAVSPISPLSGMVPVGGRPRTYSSVQRERQARLNAHMSQRRNLHAAMLPHVNTLVLTNVPPFTASNELSQRLIHFITQCAEEASYAKINAKLDYTLPPGRLRHKAALEHAASKNFALKRFVLELAPEKSRGADSIPGHWQRQNLNSITGDYDSENFYSASSNDFSFFGDEELEIPTLEPVQSFFRSKEKDVRPTRSSCSSGDQFASTSKNHMPMLPTFNTVSALSAFRKERKAAHERNLSSGVADHETRGYWEGVVSVVRPAHDLSGDEEEDYFGNRFEKGWLYR